MSAGSEARAREMERKGINMDWYWRGRDRRAAESAELDPEAEPSGDECSFLTMYYIEYEIESTVDFFAHIFTIKSDGTKHKEHKVRPTKKTGDPVWWCEACGGVFKTWPLADRHWVVDENKDAPSE